VFVSGLSAADHQDTANTYDGNGNPTTYKAASVTYDESDSC